MKDFDEVTVAEAADFLATATSVLIFVHVNPDGDAIGSATALKKILEAMGKRADVAAPTPVPDYAEFLTEDCGIFSANVDCDDYDDLVTVDVASTSQLGAFSYLADEIGLSIDHHANSEPFAPNLTDASSSAAGEIIYDICLELIGLGYLNGIDADVARRLFAAISSDTGSFKYSNTTPRTFRVAAELTEIIDGAEDGGYATWDISRMIHDTLTEKDLRINAAIPGKIKLFEDGALAVCLITASDMKNLGVEDRDMGGAIDIVRSLKGVLVAVTLRQRPDGSDVYRISARANADIDVAEVCGLFGGGGHTRAAGASLNAPSPGKALATAVNAFSPSVAEFKRKGDKS